MLDGLRTSMGKIDDMFKASHLRSYFEGIDKIERININYNGDEHIYELHINGRDDKLESKLEQSLSVYGPEITYEYTQDGNPYYRVAVSGLMRDLEQ